MHLYTILMLLLIILGFFQEECLIDIGLHAIGESFIGNFKFADFLFHSEVIVSFVFDFKLLLSRYQYE